MGLTLKAVLIATLSIATRAIPTEDTDITVIAAILIIIPTILPKVEIMIDLHTHILPGVDDGAEDIQVSLEMLKLQAANGVNTVVCTPHFYPDEENPEHFLKRREIGWNILQEGLHELSQEERRKLPKLLLGAEVAWVPELTGIGKLTDFAISDTENFLLELPMGPWNNRFIDQLYHLLGCCGMTPVIAHYDRYMYHQKRDHLEEILDMSVPIQLSASCLLEPGMKRDAIRLIKHRQVHVIASDCHDCSLRAPNLGAAMKVVEKKFGAGCVEELNDNAKDMISNH